MECYLKVFTWQYLDCVYIYIHNLNLCPARSTFWFLNLNSMVTKQYIVIMVQPLPFNYCTLVLTQSLYVKIDFGCLIIFHAC